MKNTMITMVLAFFLVTALSMLSLWFYFSVEYSHYEQSLRVMEGYEILDEDRNPVPVPGTLQEMTKSKEYFQKLEKQLEGDVSDRAKRIERAEQFYVAEHNRKKQMFTESHNAMLEFHDPSKLDASRPEKLDRVFKENENNFKAQKETISGLRKDNRRNVAAAEKKRQNAYNDYRTVKKDLEDARIVRYTRELDLERKFQAAKHRHDVVMERERTTREPYQEHGSIIQVGEEDTNYVAIDKGLNEGIKRGMRFKVFYRDRGGEIINVGQVVVRDVHLRYSDCTVLPFEPALPVCPQCRWVAPEVDMRYCIYCFNLEGLVRKVQKLDKPNIKINVKRRDPFRPIMKGDLIWNDRYNHSKELRFYVGTKTAFRSRREISRFIEENGGIVVETLDHTVDYFIPGSDRQSEAVYKEARLLGVRIMTVPEVYAWFGKPKPE